MTAIRVRPIRPEDAPDLARLHAQGFDEGWSAADFEGWLARSSAFFAVAEAGGQVVSFALAQGAGEDVELLTIATDPVWRARGLGAQILSALDVEAVARSHSRWVLEVATDNAPAQALYRQQGFVEIGRRKGYYPRADGRCDALVLARSVGPATP